MSKSRLNRVCLQLFGIWGLTQPSAESLSRLHSWIMCSHTAWWQRGENYYFQMFLPEVAWSRSEPIDRMLEFYSWPSYAPSARYSPTSRHANKEGWVPKAAGQRRTEEGVKRFSQRDFEEWSSQIPGSLVGGASLPPHAQKTCCGEIGRPRSRTDSASSDSVLFTLSRYPIVPAQCVHCVCAPCAHCVCICVLKSTDGSRATQGARCQA